MKPGNEKKLAEIIRVVFELPDTYDLDDVKKDGLASWDSIAEVTLVVALETEFDLSIDIGEIQRSADLDAVKNVLSAKGL